MKNFLQILIGICLFIISFLLYLKIDFLELYLFSIPYIKLFNFAAVLTRILVAYLFFSSLVLIFGLANKQLKKFLSFSLFVASGFLFIHHLFSWIQLFNCFFYKFLNHKYLLSLLLFLISISIYFLKNQEAFFPFKKANKLLVVLTLVISLTLINIISAPDFILYSSYQTMDKEINYEKLQPKTTEVLKEVMQKDSFEIYSFFNPGCPFCKKASNKISLMAMKNGFTNNVIFVFSGNQSSIKPFYLNNQIDSKIKNIHIADLDLLDLCNGQIPSLLLIRNDTIKYRFGYRTINEEKIKQIFK